MARALFTARPALRRALSGTITWALLATLGAGDAAAKEPAAPLVPREALLLAVQHNPSLREAGLAVDEASEKLRAQRSRKPWILQSDVNLGADETPASGVIESGVRESQLQRASAELVKELLIGTRLSARFEFVRTLTRIPFTVPDLNISEVREIGPNYGATGTFSVSQPLLRGRGSELGRLPERAAEQERSVAELAKRRSLNDIIAQVIDQYMTWAAAEAQIISRRQSRDRAKKLEELTLVQIDAGQVAALERDIVAQRVAAAEQTLLLAKLTRDDAAESLVQLIGLPMTGGASRFTAPKTLPTMEVSDLEPVDVLLKRALVNNPDVRLLDGEVAAAKLQLITSEDATKSSLDAIANVSQSSLSEEIPDALGQVLTLDFTGWFIGLTFRMPFDNGLAEGFHDANTIALRRAELRREIALRGVELRVRQTRRLVMVQSQRTALTDTEIALARKNTAQMQEKFEAGLASFLEVLQLEEELQAAEGRYYEARVELMRALVALHRLTGTLLTVYGLDTDGVALAQ